MIAVRGYAEVIAEAEYLVALADPDRGGPFVGYASERFVAVLREAAALLAAQGEQLAAVVAALDQWDKDRPGKSWPAAIACVSAIAKAVGR